MKKGLVGSSISTAGTGPKSPLGKLLAAGLMVLDQPQVMRAIIDAANSEKPEEALAQIASGIINGIDEKASGKVPPDALSKFAIELVEALAELAGAAVDEEDGTLGPRTLKLMLEQAAQEADKMGQPQQPQQPQPQQAEQPMPEEA